MPKKLHPWRARGNQSGSQKQHNDDVTDYPWVSEDEKILKNLYCIACMAGAKRGGRGGGRKASPLPPSLFPFFPIPYPFQRLLRRLSTVRVELLKVINLGDVTMTTGALFAVNLGLPKHFLEFLLEHSIITLKAKRIH